MADTITHRLLFGRSGLELRLPATATVLRGQHAPAVPDPAGAIAAALQKPIGCDSLTTLLQRKRPKSVVITISDITRPVPNRIFLPVLLETFRAQGIRDEQVTIVVGTGLHRPSTPAEKVELVGPDILKRCRVVDHRADDPKTVVRVSDDPPVSINAIFAQADFRIVTGLIEPHFMAGYSGGRKGVCPALVDLQTVQRFHGHAILNDPRSSNGVIEGNPCHAESLRVARIVGVDFLLNVAINIKRELCGVYAGDMEAAHQAGVRDVQNWTSARVEQPFDLVVSNGGGYPLDLTLYQTIKGIVTPLPACHEKTTLLIVSDMSEGVGSQSYTKTMLHWSKDWRGFLEHITHSPQVIHDQWSIQMHCRTLERIGQERLRLVSDGLPQDVQSRLWVTPVDGLGTVQERAQAFVDRYVRENPQARIAVIPDGPYTLLR